MDLSTQFNHIYLVSFEDIPRICSTIIELWNRCDNDKSLELKLLSCKDIFSGLVNSLCSMDTEKKKKLTAEIESQHFVFDKRETLQNILELWVNTNENQGNSANLQMLISTLRTINCWSTPVFAWKIETLLAEYSLPIKREEGLKAVYFLNRRHTNFQQSLAPKRMENHSWQYSQRKVINNPVILVEVFKNLHLKDQMSFRMVNQLWSNEMLAAWRKLARINIRIKIKKFEKDPKGILMNDFLQVFKNDGTIIHLDQDEQISKRNFLKHPFRSYAIWFSSYSRIATGKGNSFYPSQNQNLEEFWKRFGSHVENLWLYDANFGTNQSLDIVFYKIISSCRNLKKIHFVDCNNFYRMENTSEENHVANFYKQGQVFAEKLQTLILDINELNETILKRILWLCPNITELSVKNEKSLELLYLPTVKETNVKLKTLILDLEMDWRSDFLCFRHFISSNLTSSLRHLELIKVPLDRSSLHPFNLFAAISHCSRKLETLKIKAVYDSGLNNSKRSGPKTEFQTAKQWFIDLYPFQFSNLVKLECSFVLRSTSNMSSLVGECILDRRDLIRFDFDTLRQMPCLEELVIKFEMSECYSKPFDPKAITRYTGTTDWVFKGSKDIYLPVGLIMEASYPAQDEIILLKNLKRFTFLCWDLNDQDIQILAGWFPNLTYLEANIASQALHSFFGIWEKLRDLWITTERLIPLREIREFKKRREQLQIKLGIRFTKQLVEVKERDGYLFYCLKSSLK